MLGWNEEIKKQFKHCGKNVYIGHNVMINSPENIIIGDNVRIDPFVLITCGKVTINNYCSIGAYSMLQGHPGEIIMQDWSFITYGVKLLSASEDYSGEHGPVLDFWGDNKVYHDPIILEKYSGVCTNSVLMPGIQLPEGCIIGANTFVNSNYYKYSSPLLGKSKLDLSLEKYSIYAGNPLTFLKQRNKDKINSLAPIFEKSGKNCYENM